MEKDHVQNSTLSYRITGGGGSLDNLLPLAERRAGSGPLFRLRPRVVRWWFPAAPILFVAGCLVTGLLILANDPLPALLGAAVVLAGDVLRRFFRKEKER